MSAFVARYRPALERIADGRIAPRLRRRVGPDSVAQSVCRTFLRRMGDNPYVVADGDALWSLLCAIALTKVRERIRYHGRQRRDVGREVPLDAARRVGDGGRGPAEAVALNEAFEQALEGLRDEEQTVLMLRLRGKTQREIADDVGCSERTVRRLLTGIARRLRTQL